MAGLEEGTQLASHDRARVPIAPEQVALDLDEGLTGALVRRARTEGLTLNTLVQAAWALLLGRMTGRDDVVFGVTVADRTPEIAGVETMVGLFINTLPLRIRLPASKSLLALLKDVQDTQSLLSAHQHLGLAEIQNLVGLGELFDTLVVFENYPIDRERLSTGAGGLRLVDVSILDATHYPLSLMAIPGEQLKLRLEYRPDLFDRAAIEAMADRLLRLLEAAVADPDRAIGGSTFWLPTSATRFCMVGTTPRARCRPATLPELFAAQVARTPDAVAVVFEEQTLSYARARCARQSAGPSPARSRRRPRGRGRALRRALAGDGGRAARHPQGGRRLPAARPELSAGAARLHARGYPCAGCWSRIRACSIGCPRMARAPVCLDVDWPRRSRAVPLTVPQPSRSIRRHRAYVIYTSGSTGTPKGVAVEHAQPRQTSSSTLAADFGGRTGFPDAASV